MSHLTYKSQAKAQLSKLISEINFQTKTHAELLKEFKVLFEGVWIEELDLPADYKLALKVECILRFGQFFFADIFRVEFADFHREVIANLLTLDRFVLAAPREHAKSTIISFLYPMWCIAYQLKHFILIVSNSSSEARDFVSDIKEELEQNDDYLICFGQMETLSRWTSSDIITKTGIRVLAKGAGSSMRGLKKSGNRPDLVIGDDLEDEEMVESAMRRDKLHHWFNKTLINVMGKTGQIGIIGTILHYDAVLVRLLEGKKKDPRWFVKIYQAEWTATDAKGVAFKQTLWPEWWDIERLLFRRADIGEYAYQSEFLNNPIDDKTALIKRNWIYGDDRQVLFDLKDMPKITDGERIGEWDFVKKVGAIDPAISQKETADFTALGSAGVCKEGYIWVYQAAHKRITLKGQVDWICESHEANDYDVFGIETVAYQTALKQEVDRISRELGIYVPTQRLIPTRDKVARVKLLSVYFEQGIIKIERHLADLINELLVFPKGEHDDLVDLLVYLVLLAKPSKQRARIFAKKPKGF